MQADSITVSLVRGNADSQQLVTLQVAAGSRVRDALAASGWFNQNEIDSLDVGIFNHSVALDKPLRDGDRIEIYRPLTIDPKESRRIRAEVKRKRLGLQRGRA